MTTSLDRQRRVLLQLRNEGLLSTKLLAEWADCHPKTAGRWIAGERPIPVEALHRIVDNGGSDVGGRIIDGLVNVPAGRVTVAQAGGKTDGSLAPVIEHLTKAMQREVDAVKANGSVCRRDADEILVFIQIAIGHLAAYHESVDQADGAGR